MADTSSLKYTKSDEWVKIDGDIATIGITQHAAEALGDIALVQLPEVGRILQREEKFGEVESIKAVADLFAPIAGEVVNINEGLETAPETINNTPYDDGWMVKIRLSDKSQIDSLLTEEQYNAGLE
jgi:glycine cleavage system H protein